MIEQAHAILAILIAVGGVILYLIRLNIAPIKVSLDAIGKELKNLVEKIDSREDDVIEAKAAIVDLQRRVDRLEDRQ